MLIVVWIWAGRKGDHILRNEIKIPRNQYNVDFKVKFVFTQSGLCVLMFIQVRSMHTARSEKGMVVSSTSGTFRNPGQTLNILFWDSWKKPCSPGPQHTQAAVCPCPVSGCHGWACTAGILSKAAICCQLWHEIPDDHWRSNLFSKTGQLLTFHFTLLGSGPVRRGGASHFTQMISWSS